MSTRVTALSVVVFMAGGLASSAALAQTATEPYAVPRTSWGDPDLQGVWDYRTITPMERRPELGDRAYYTEEEVAQLEGRAARRMDKPPDENTPVGLVHAEYLTDPGRFVDESHRTSLIVDPPSGRMPPLTAAAQERQAAARAATGGAPARPGGRADSYTDRTRSSAASRAAPPARAAALYNNNIRITQAPGYAAMVNEMVQRRLVPLDGNPFGNVQSYNGESRGHWEGDTLVVETQLQRQSALSRRGRSLHLTELYARGADRIDFRSRSRSDTWTQPWTAEYSMRTGEGELYEYACHEGNYGLRNILENARDEERKAAGARR
jgi:hypothetical protein